MKNNLYYIILFTLGLFIATSCENNTVPTFQMSDSFIQLSDTTYVFEELGGGQYFVTFLLASAPPQNEVEIHYEISNEAYGTSGAVLGQDFKIIYPSDSILKFVKGSNRTSITFQTIDNGDFTEDKYFDVTLVYNSEDLPMNIDGKNKARVTISDDEHPLHLLLGTYLQTDSVLDEETVNGPYQVTISAIKGNTSEVTIRNFWNGGTMANGDYYDITASVNTTSKQISLAAQQVIAPYVEDEDTTDITASYYNISSDEFDNSLPIIGTFNENGNITFNAWGPVIADGYFYIYNSSYLQKQ